ncbi:ATP-binding protein [Rhodoferax saidenbachensis]|uniref:histidine kinase n=1 Tax=Rhodoferax saidenbachensis TaxID=1484693 RepID=A0ABU1ZQA4_9BURK|nr:ATP-binding protein [Rhodoferax saidenbachensis]MDR7307673.1 PAS domain S-box-containing protein [Rhodoferax saidenbachensis]
MSQSPQAQLALLQQQLQSLQEKHDALQATLDAQRTQANQWLEQRTRELQREAQEQKKAETLQRVFYRIAERATAGLPFYDFLKAVHELLGELLYAKNFFVCLCSQSQNTVDFPYYVDEKDGDTMQCNDVPRGRGMTEFVLRTAEPQLIDTKRFMALQECGEITEATGDLTFTTWLGVPMKVEGRISGALVVQGYEEGVKPYSEADADILSFVANHVGAAIERYQAIEAMRSSEARYRLVIENVGVGVVVVQDGRMVFANPSMVRIVGHPLDYLLSQPFTATIHPDDVPAVLDRHQRRLRGETVETHYGFRVITQQGEERALELSAVVIQWNQRNATLLFVVDATARLQAEQSQRQALQQQIALNDMKTRFIAMASHEFRTPLATIHGSVELLQHYNDRMPADKKLLTLQKIDDAVERMTHMLENVLVIGRTDAGRLEFKPHALGIATFCHALVDEMRSAMARQLTHVQLHLDLPPVERLYWLDDTLIRNIVGNLLSNAVKYSPQGGTVLFAVQELDGALVFTVRDEGIGIPEADQAQLFVSFHRASNVGPIAGTGLGLSIVKEAVTCHLGQIAVHSTVGQGSTFTVTLPTRRCAAED